MKRSARNIALGLVSMAALSGCLAGGPEWQPDKKAAHISLPANRQLAPQETYSRLRWANLPSPMPEQPAEHDRPAMIPVIHLTIQDQTLEEVGALLAKSYRYSSYCASGVAHQKVTIEGLGTIDELADQIERQAKVKVVVDHSSHEVRITAKTPVEPDFVDSKDTTKVTKEVIGNEHQSTN